MRPELTTIDALLDRHPVILLDAFGVLVDGSRALPGAAALIAHLEARKQPYFIVTNGSARTVVDTAKSYQDLGLPIPAERVITSGSVLRSRLECSRRPTSSTAGSVATSSSFGR